MKSHPTDLLTEITKYIAESHKLIASGKITELSGLDERVKTLCEDVLTLSPQDRERYAQELSKLTLDLDGLAKTLYEQRDIVAQEMQKSSGTQKANVAYKKADAVDNFGNKDE